MDISNATMQEAERFFSELVATEATVELFGKHYPADVVLKAVDKKLYRDWFFRWVAYQPVLQIKETS